jgi:hypothetical protein
LAESTGKQGKGIIPVDRERLGPPELYGNDRVFAYVRLEGASESERDLEVAALEKAGHPVVRISMADIYDLGQEFFRWEVATAVAGAIIGVHPFNQPVLEEGGIQLFTDEKNAMELAKSANDKSVAGYLKAHLNRIQPGDYFAALGYVQMNSEHEERLQALRHQVRDKKRVATCLGFGPRFLHSTGQAYKGGPNSGVFLQVTCHDRFDVPVPDQKYTFGIVKAAQARGDFQVLAERRRRALRVHLGTDVNAGLTKLQSLVKKALTA